jgi:hypothetical protein
MCEPPPERARKSSETLITVYIRNKVGQDHSQSSPQHDNGQPGEVHRDYKVDKESEDESDVGICRGRKFPQKVIQDCTFPKADQDTIKAGMVASNGICENS